MSNNLKFCAEHGKRSRQKKNIEQVEGRLGGAEISGLMLILA